MRRFGALVFVAMVAAAAAVAEEPDLVTDRPDFTESPVVVPLGMVQVESGLMYAEDEDTTVLSGPELLVRWPVADRWELRFGVPDYVRMRNGEAVSGLADASVGAKAQLGSVPGGFAAGVIVGVTLPTGENRLTSDAVDPELICTVGKDVDERYALGFQVAAAWPTEEEDRNTRLSATTVLGIGLNDGWSSFVELAVEHPDESDTALTLHHGYTYLVNHNLQLDVHVGAGLNDAAPDWFVAAG